LKEEYDKIKNAQVTESNTAQILNMNAQARVSIAPGSLPRNSLAAHLASPYSPEATSPVDHDQLMENDLAMHMDAQFREED
jgi:hypothetical protein